MSFENRYTLLDRCLHHVAFSTRTAQLSLADFEDRLFRQALDETRLRKPVFVTALPRAGTTLLLNVLSTHSALCAHSYRDMPFLMLPLLWHRLSRRFGVTDKPRARAHGDGMLVSVDSPEAFEEMIWKLFWRKHYQQTRIIPWSDAENAEFLEFFTRHMRKIAWLRATGTKQQARYLSKNNLNIARIAYLRSTFPDAIIIVPFRHPLEHAASLLRQHGNFHEIHKQDAFARLYMREIGHFDFGQNLRPVDFGGWLARSRTRDAMQLGFWLEYWVAAYSHLLNELGEGVHALSYEGFCAQGSEALRRLAGILDIDLEPGLLAEGERIRAPRRQQIDTAGIDPELLEQAEAVYQALLQRSSIGGAPD